MDNKKNRKTVRSKALSIAKPEKVNSFTRRKEQSKDDIRKAAIELFSQFGIEKVNISDIARKAGVAQATIYNNFGSKDNLVLEFMYSSVDQAMARFQEISTSDKPYREKLRDFPVFAAKIFVEGRAAQGGNLIFPRSMDISNDPEIKKIKDAIQEKMTALFLEVVREGKKQGQVNKKITDEALTIYFRFLMDIMFDSEIHYRFHETPKLAQDVIFLFMHGIGGEEKKSGKK